MGTSLKEVYQAKISGGELSPDAAQANAVDLLEDLIRRISDTVGETGLFAGLFRKATTSPIKGLYLWGGVGRGKSMLMDMFFDQLEIDSKERIHFLDFMQKTHASLHEIRQTNVDDAILPAAEKVAQNVKVLCLDEMQIDSIADAMIVGRLFEQLFDRGVAICTTSNRPPTDLYKDGLNRELFLPFIDLLGQKMTVHELAKGVDHRKNRLAGEKIYFSPADATARKAINRIWHDLTGGNSREMTLQVMGRPVRLPQFWNGATRSRFWELCAQPLGPGDFLAIANAVRVLVLEDVPLLSRTNYNEAKRFVMLVDALYEAKVRLIMSAAAVPDKIYIEGEGAFEFERAASRLEEMQSADWSNPDTAVR